MAEPALHLRVACALCQQTFLTRQGPLITLPTPLLRVGSQEVRVLVLVLVWAHLPRSNSTAHNLSQVSALWSVLSRIREGLVSWLGLGWCPAPCPHLHLLLRFATKERDGLLLYNGRFNEKHDFVALEVIQEQVQLTFSAGDPGCPMSLPVSQRPYVSWPLTPSHPPSQPNLGPVPTVSTPSPFPALI